VVSIVGRSGSGKSTLLHCLAGILLPYNGTVCVSDLPLSELNKSARAKARLRHVGMVFQHGELLPELPIGENVALPLVLSGARKSTAWEDAREALRLLGIAELFERYPSEVSGGEQQRAAIARAVVHRPALVLADEPTGMLDDDTSDMVMERLRSAARDVGAAVVVVTHSARVAASTDRQLRIADQALVPA
jgi:putative ABC transport system ATP-binding protein